MKRELTCIICPRGCALTVNTDGEKTTVSGNSCPKGEKYGIEECIHPTRTVTGIIRVENRENTMVSVKTSRLVPKENIYDIMKIICKTSVKAPVKIGDIVLINIFGADIVATKDIV